MIVTLCKYCRASSISDSSSSRRDLPISITSSLVRKLCFLFLASFCSEISKANNRIGNTIVISRLQFETALQSSTLASSLSLDPAMSNVLTGNIIDLPGSFGMTF
uniref:Uncharacterized protein n=1 Tax=Amphimedon queenslandica TaxID=400682 RepID=A0A1X7T478_AMPQE